MCGTGKHDYRGAGKFGFAGQAQPVHRAAAIPSVQGRTYDNQAEHAGNDDFVRRFEEGIGRHRSPDP